MKYYAGLDVSLKETFICILREDGQKVYESHTYTDPMFINEALKKVIPPLIGVYKSRISQAAFSSFCLGVIPPRAILGRSLL